MWKELRQEHKENLTVYGSQNGGAEILYCMEENENQFNMIEEKGTHTV